MIPRRGVKIKIFLSVVIYVVKAAFVPFSATGGNPANAGVARLCGVSPYPVPDTATALPNVAPYQLSHTRIFNFCHYTTAGRKIKDFLSVVIPVVKAAFVPFSATGGKPAIARAARLCGLLSKLRMDRVYALPNQARYQLRYTRIKICRPHPGGISTIPAFFLACKGKICPGAFCIPEAYPPCRITAPGPPSGRPPDRSFPKPRPGPPGPCGRRPPAYDRWAFEDPNRG